MNTQSNYVQFELFGKIFVCVREPVSAMDFVGFFANIFCGFSSVGTFDMCWRCAAQQQQDSCEFFSVSNWIFECSKVCNYGLTFLKRTYPDGSQLYLRLF